MNTNYSTTKNIYFQVFYEGRGEGRNKDHAYSTKEEAQMQVNYNISCGYWSWFEERNQGRDQ